MKKALAILMIFVVMLSAFAMFAMGRTAMNLKNSTAQTRKIVKPAFGDSTVIFGPRIGISNATYLGSLILNGEEIAYYNLLPGNHYVTSDIPPEQPLNWDKIKNLSQVKLENYDVPPGNNYELSSFGSATKLFSSNDEIEGMEIVGDYVYITYKRTSNNIEMRYLSNFTLVKAITLGDSTYYHCGGILYDGHGHLWTILAQPIDAGPSYIYEFDLHLTEIQHFVTDDDHYGTVFFADGNIIVVGNWNSQEIAEFNTTNHQLIWKVATPPPFQFTQDSAYLGDGYYLGARDRNDYNYSGIYLYHWNGTNIKFDTNLIAYRLIGLNPIGVDKEGYIYADVDENVIYKTRDVFLPLVYSNVTMGDKYNIGFSDVWPCQDSGYEQYTIGGTGSDTAVGFEIHTSTINRTTVIAGSTTGIFKWSYYGVYTNVNGQVVKGGLPTSANLDYLGAQTWGSANLDLQGSTYLTKAVPYIVEETPSPPENLKATAGDSYVILSWNIPSDSGSSNITEYKIYRGTSAGDESYYASVNGTTTTFNDTSVTNGITYYYYVTAVNSAGESNASNEVNATPVGKPSPPRNLQATVGNGYIKLKWDIPTDNGGSEITEYKIYRGLSSGNESLIATVSNLTTNYTDSAVTNGNTYYYYVTAVNSVGESNASNEVSVTYQVSSAPSPPLNLQAHTGNRYVNLTWSPPADNGGSPVIAYKIYRNGTLIAMVPGNQLWYNDTNVENGVNYTYYVTAVNAVGESTPSNTVAVRLTSPSPRGGTSNNLQGGGGGLLWLWIILGVIIAGILIGVALLIKKRRPPVEAARALEQGQEPPNASSSHTEDNETQS